MQAKQTVTVATQFGHIKAWENDVITQQLQSFGAHTRNELAMLGSLLEAGDTVIDAGAHIGTFSLAFAQLLGSTANIHAFEADADNFTLLQDNIRSNGHTAAVFAVNAVISDTQQSFKKVTPDPDNSGMHYFVPDAEDSATGPRSLSLDQWAEDAALQRCALLKIDVEGAEVAVLRSATNILKRFRPLLYIEINQAALAEFDSRVEDIEAVLQPLGYSFYRNVGQRNSSHDRFRIAKLPSMSDGGYFYDCLAVPAAHPRKPHTATAALNYLFWRLRRLFRRLRRQMQKNT